VGDTFVDKILRPLVTKLPFRTIRQQRFSGRHWAHCRILRRPRYRADLYIARGMHIGRRSPCYRWLPHHPKR